MKRLKLLPLLFCFICFGCEDFLECIVNNRPEIPDKSFKVGTTDDFYFDDIRSEIKNEPRDNDYTYYYDVDGLLPNGIEIFSEGRTLFFEGTPIEAGTFRFTIHLSVDPPIFFDPDIGEYEGELCRYSTSKSFVILIN